MNTNTVDHNKEAHRQIVKFLLWWFLWWFLWAVIAFGGWNQIYTRFSGTMVIVDKIWLPKEYRMLNQVNDKTVRAFDFQTALPTVAIGLDDFIRTFSSADIAVTSRVNQLSDLPEAFVTYSAVKENVVYRATQKYTHGRMDKVEWVSPDTLRHEGWLMAGSVLSGLAWAIFWFVMFFHRDGESPNIVRMVSSSGRYLRAYFRF